MQEVPSEMAVNVKINNNIVNEEKTAASFSNANELREELFRLERNDNITEIMESSTSMVQKKVMQIIKQRKSCLFMIFLIDIEHLGLGTWC